MSKIKFNLAGWKEKLLNGADINKPDETGHTALEQAVWANSIRGIKFCLRHGANINQKDIKLKISLSTLSNVVSAKQRKAKLANLLALVSDINVRDENRNTILYEFIKRNNFRITKALIEAGADVNVKNNRGETPLSCAVKYKAKGKIIDLLLAYGAKVDTEDKMVQSAVAAFLARQKSKLSATQLGLFKEKKG
ncbi:MAG: ankyrin repeat domain-containing protein [Alphaproteobacteria bacterium]|nr:ankyrin repeat domain-containing protein [Alphaproteobacteria bacterium]